MFARLALAAALDFSPLPLAALLGHPLMRLGRAPDVLAAEARALELSVLRTILPPVGLDDIGAAFAAARAAAKNRHAHRALQSLGEAELRGAEALLRDLAAALAPLRGLASDAPLGECLAAHRTALAALAAPDEAGPGLGTLDALFDEAVEAAPESFRLSLADYAALFDSLLAGQRAPPEPGGHPRLAILGLLEARLLSFDLTLLAGLDETVWPPAAETDAFLNRPMRARTRPFRARAANRPDRARFHRRARRARGRAFAREKARGIADRRLAVPATHRRGRGRGDDAADRGARRRIGSASRARSIGPTPRSRSADRSPGRNSSCGRSSSASPASRRCAAIPTRSTPKASSELQPLAPIGAEAGPREIGDVWHAALQKFSETFVVGLSPDEARVRLMAIARAAFAPLLADAAFRALRWPRIVEGLEAFLAFDAARRERGERDLGREGRPAGDPAVRRFALHADCARGPHRAAARGRRGGDRLQDRRAARRHGSPGRLRARN